MIRCSKHYSDYPPQTRGISLRFVPLAMPLVQGEEWAVLLLEVNLLSVVEPGGWREREGEGGREEGRERGREGGREREKGREGGRERGRKGEGRSKRRYIVTGFDRFFSPLHIHTLVYCVI